MRTLICKSTDYERSTILSSSNDPSIDKLFRAIFRRDRSHKIVCTGHKKYRYLPSNEYRRYVAKFKK